MRRERQQAKMQGESLSLMRGPLSYGIQEKEFSRGHGMACNRRRVCCAAVRVKVQTNVPGWGGQLAVQLHLIRGELREGIGRGFLEAREPAAENEAHLVRGAVALLGDLNFGLLALFGGSVHLRPVRPVDEH